MIDLLRILPSRNLTIAQRTVYWFLHGRRYDAPPRNVNCRCVMVDMAAPDAIDVSVGCAMSIVGRKKVYTGELFKPWTWLRFEVVDVVELSNTDHIAITTTILPRE